MNVEALARSWARYPILWSPRVSGDGKWLAWTWTGITETGEVWAAPTDGSRPPERLTEGQDHFYVRLARRCTQPITMNEIANSLPRRAAAMAQYLLFRNGPLASPGTMAGLFARFAPESYHGRP